MLAEIPQGLSKHSSNEIPTIEAMYLQSGLGTGPVVQGKVRVNGEFQPKRFVARNLKPIHPVSWKLDLAGDLLVRVERAEAPGVIADGEVRVGWFE